MRQATALLLLAGYSAAFQFPFKLWPSPTSAPTPGPEPTVTDVPQSSRIAIIGAGAGGSSAAFWISKAKERYGLDAGVDVYDRYGYIGGRSTTVYPYNDTSYSPVELGASVFVQINKNMWRASDEFNLTRYSFEDEDGEMGLWDGQSFVFRYGATKGFFGSLFDNVKILWRYGYFSPKNTQKLVKTMTDKFLRLYAPETPRWENVTDLPSAFEWEELISQTGSEYFRGHGVSEKFTNEVLDAMTLVNYAQDIESIHSLEAACSIAASGASSIKGGNWQVFQNFVQRSGARVFLDTNVTSITRKSSTEWTVLSSHGSADYRAVILAAPYHSTGIALPDDLAALIPKQPYVRLHVTLLTTSAPTPNPEYFGLAKGASVPTTVLTTLEGVRKGGKAPEFNSLTYHGKTVREEREDQVEEGAAVTEEGEGTTATAPAKDEWVVKIFSMAPISDEWLSDMFQGQVGWVLRKEWDAYPVLPPTTTFPPIKLDRGFFYVNAFEPLISTMETETIASRNVVEQLLREEYGTSLCAPVANETVAPVNETGTAEQVVVENVEEEEQSQPQPDAVDFVYGWDC
ncbi:hypothetical protein EW146_g7327 [Bondarzewia mesenterica]|uniref:Prenylcysteine lyase domain-containing protein n=1 Tax=Bondarzewia mesenterica TaxID=1095465 RepID=A0A4S4LL40_9AGAM|nr:hypothetical protein EW146_g7327 [Bondarzewia mesenterica]